MISKHFFKSSIIYTIVGALPYTSGFLLLIWFTRYLTPAQFGVNVLYISLMYFIQIFSSFGLDAVASLMYIDYRDDQKRLSEFIGTVLIGLIVIGTLTFVVFFFGGFHLFNLIFSENNVLELIPLGIYTIFSAIMNSVFKTYSTLLVYQQRPMRFFFLNISNFVLTIGISLAILWAYPFTLYGPVIGRFVAIAIIAAVSVGLLIKEYGFKGNVNFIKPIFVFAYPILIYGFLTWVVNYIDRFIILRFMTDPALVGIYDFGVKLAIGIELLLIGLVNAINPKVFVIWKEKAISESTVEANRYYNGLTAFMLLLIPAFVLLVPMLVPIVIKKEIYFRAFGFLAILAAGNASRVWYYMFLAPLFYFKRTKALPLVFTYSAIFEIVAGMIMIKYFGLMGAVWVNFMVKPIQAFFLWRESRKVFDFHFNRWKIFYLPVIFMLFVLVSEFFVTKTTQIYFHSGQLLISVVLVWFAYRKELIPFAQKLLRF
ncbi:MAG: oligosaccharide flippase family protein [Bacteroidota bacterium]